MPSSLAGIDDPNGYADQKTPEELAAEVEAACPDAFWLLLAHRNNLFAERYSRLGADLVISGHGHGGIIRLPFTDGLISVERTLFPSYTAGFYEVESNDLFVSRGLGELRTQLPAVQPAGGGGADPKPFLAFGGCAPVPPFFDAPAPAHGTDGLGFARRRAGGRGRNMFLPETFRGLRPRTPSYFLLVQKVTKNTHRGGTLSMGSLPYEPHPRDDTKGGARPPFGFPPQDFYLSCYSLDAPVVAIQEPCFD